MILRDIIKKNLLLEKRIAQLTANVEIVLGLDLAITRSAWKLEQYEEENLTQRVYFNATYHF